MGQPPFASLWVAAVPRSALELRRGTLTWAPAAGASDPVGIVSLDDVRWCWERGCQSVGYRSVVIGLAQGVIGQAR